QGPFDQIFLGEDRGFDSLAISTLNLFQFDPEHLFRIVPLVERGADIEPLIALEADKRGIQRLGEHLCDFGFADAGLAFEENGFTHRDREVYDGGERPVAYVSMAAESLLKFFDCYIPQIQLVLS